MIKKAEHHRHTAKILLSARQIQRRVKRLAEEISKDYGGKKLTLVAVLKGSVIFFSDLVRHLAINCSVDFIAVSSYEGSDSQGALRLVGDLRESPARRDLLIVEDIADSGRTLAFVLDHLRQSRPRTLKTCVLLDKESAREVPVRIDYRAFSIPDEFVVGYGLDFDEEYRGLPYIGVLKTEILRKKRTQRHR